MAEQWKAVEGYVGRYDVSNEGRVRSIGSRQPGRVLKPGKMSRGYLSVMLYDGSSPKRPKSHLVHKLVMAAFGPPQPSAEHQVNHEDLSKSNNYIGNLEWTTAGGNVRHAAAAGVYSGERNGRCKISDADMVKIQERFAAAPNDFKLCGEISREYGISGWYARQLRRGNYRKRQAPVTAMDSTDWDS